MYVCFASSTITIGRLGSRSIELRIAGTDWAGQDSIGVLELLGQSHVLPSSYEMSWSGKVCSDFETDGVCSVLLC